MESVYAILDKSSREWIWVKQSLGEEEDLFSGTFTFVDEAGSFYFLLDKEKQHALHEYGIQGGNGEYGLLKCRLKIFNRIFFQI